MSARLHLLCSPFPSPQGTQGAIASMLATEARAGIVTELVAFPESYGATSDVRLEHAVHRLPRLAIPVGPRSGPSLARLAYDVAAIPAFRAHAGRRTPRGSRAAELVIAHNVEAALVCALSRTPFVYVAHTSMRDELPSYGTGAPSARAAVGAFLDRVAVTTAERVAAIAPALAHGLARRHDRRVDYVPIPWGGSERASGADDDERVRARAELGLPPDAWVVLHAGNLDAYQGLPDVVAAVRAMAPLARAHARRAEVVLLVATCSDPEPLRRAAADVTIRFAPLAVDEERRRAHAAADVVLLARRAAGGLPVKLLEAFSRGVPVVATRTTTAGLALGDAAIVVDDGDPNALAQAASALLSGDERSRQIAAARVYLVTHHGGDAYLDAIAIAARSRR